MTIHQALREMRSGTGETIDAFSKRLGISRNTYREFEKRKVPGLPTLFRLASLASLLDRRDIKNAVLRAINGRLPSEISARSPQIGMPHERR